MMEVGDGDDGGRRWWWWWWRLKTMMRKKIQHGTWVLSLKFFVHGSTCRVCCCFLVFSYLYHRFFIRSTSTSIIITFIFFFNLHHHTSLLTGLTWCHPATLNLGVLRFIYWLGVGGDCWICARTVTLEVGLRTIPSVVSSFRYLSTNSIIPGPGSI